MPPCLSIVCSCDCKDEYVLHVSHEAGCEWKVRLQYAALLDLYSRLCGVFGASGQQPFPTQLDFMSIFFGVPTELHDKRLTALQHYVDALCDRRDVTSTVAFQESLGMQVPEAVRHLRVWRWTKSMQDSTGSAVLDIIPEGQEAESSAVVDTYHITANAVLETSAIRPVAMSTCGAHHAVVKFATQRCLQLVDSSSIVELDISAREVATQGALIERLPLGVQLQFEVTACNALGQSPPISVRSMAPPHLLHKAPDPPECASIERAATSQSEQRELHCEIADLSRQLEDKEQEMLDLRFDMAVKISSIASTRSINEDLLK